MPIEVSHLTHCYSEGSALRTVALDDVSFRIEDGEFVGIIGHTGSGKSTLVQHLNGLLKPTSGQVFIDGEDLNGEHVNRRALRQRIGLVFQYPEYQLFEETVAKDIAFGPKNQTISRSGSATQWTAFISTMTNMPNGAPLSSPAARCAASPSPASSPCAPPS